MDYPAGRVGICKSWCADWEIRFHALDRRPGSEHIRPAFEEHRLARAFVGHFGGVLMDGCKVEAAMEKDAPDEDAFDHVARERDGE